MSEFKTFHGLLTDAAGSQSYENVPLLVYDCSSTLDDGTHDNSTHGAKFALTEVSYTNKNFWYSGTDDREPWISFQMPGTYEVAEVVVDDRKDYYFDRWKNVEVLVGSTPNIEDTGVQSCGKQSHKNDGITRYK